MANSTLSPPRRAHPAVDRELPCRRVPFARNLARHGERPALVTTDEVISYSNLAARVDRVARRLGDQRRLVLIMGHNTVDAVVTYIAALATGNPALLVPGENTAALGSLVATYDPDVIAGPTGDGWDLDERRDISAHRLHPGLALLLSTSGSTGSPKLVRLCPENLQANAVAIAEYLDIRSDDRAVTTLPISYCYGLSVINSHLQRGAGIILTDLSVADACFWRLARDRGATSLAGVPYTFDLLDRIGFASERLPRLRYITQAGGRLAPDRVARYAAMGRRDGWRLFVMYGQTEATARMAYLPPELAESHPHAIGTPIPGGSFRLQPLEDNNPDVGELVYSGPNVMLGYAYRAADLSLGRTVGELHTGDVARRASDGLYEIVGRHSRFAKILGLRIDPDRVETDLAKHSITAYCAAGRDDDLVVAVTAGSDEATVRRLVATSLRLPPRAIRVHTLAALPRRANGKPDYDAVRALVSTPAQPPPVPSVAAGQAESDDLCRLYAEILDRTDVTAESSFVGLGGDSLSYVEMSIRLEQALGELPANWHTTAIRDLRAAQRARPGSAASPGPARRTRAGARRARLETSVALRAFSIVLVVGTHAQLFAISGGAHLLLGVAGFNLARFHLTATPRLDRVRAILRGLRRIVIASIAWIAVVFLATDEYGVRHVLLLNYLVGPAGSHNHYWFIEALVYITLAMCALIAVPAVDRLERRYPFAVPLALAVLGLITRYQLIPGVQVRTPGEVFWLVALGWAAARASATWQRALVTLVTVATVPGFFGSAPREAVVIAGMIMLIWIPTLPSLRMLNRIAGLLAGASLYIYLTHWQVFPHLDQVSALLATLASLAAGVGVAALLRAARRLPARPGLSRLRARLPIIARERHGSRSEPSPGAGERRLR